MSVCSQLFGKQVSFCAHKGASERNILWLTLDTARFAKGLKAIDEIVAIRISF